MRFEEGVCGFSWSMSLRLRVSFSFLRLEFSSVSCLSLLQSWQVWEVCVGCASLWVETDDSDSFSDPVFGDDDSGAGCALFGYFFDYFVALHVDVDGFLGHCLVV